LLSGFPEMIKRVSVSEIELLRPPPLRMDQMKEEVTAKALIRGCGEVGGN